MQIDHPRRRAPVVARYSGRLTGNKLLVGMSGARAGFLDGFGTLRPRAIWGNCRHHRAMRTQCASALQLQARSAPRGWHHFGPNIPDGHQNGLIWGPLVPWNPVNALQSWRRLCDPNGSARVVGLRQSVREQSAAVSHARLTVRTRPLGALFSSPLMRAKLFSWHAPRRCEEQGRATSAVRLPPPHQQRGCDPR